MCPAIFLVGKAMHPCLTGRCAAAGRVQRSALLTVSSATDLLRPVASRSRGGARRQGHVHVQLSRFSVKVYARRQCGCSPRGMSTRRTCASTNGAMTCPCRCKFSSPG